jgi:hypothetical protein
MSSFLVKGESDFSCCCFSLECFLLLRFFFLFEESSESDPVSDLELELEELELLDESEDEEEEVDEDLCRLFLLFRFFLSFFFLRLEWPFSSFGNFTSLDFDASPEIKLLSTWPTSDLINYQSSTSLRCPKTKTCSHPALPQPLYAFQSLSGFPLGSGVTPGPLCCTAALTNFVCREKWLAQICFHPPAY